MYDLSLWMQIIVGVITIVGALWQLYRWFSKRAATGRFISKSPAGNLRKMQASAHKDHETCDWDNVSLANDLASFLRYKDGDRSLLWEDKEWPKDVRGEQFVRSHVIAINKHWPQALMASLRRGMSVELLKEYTGLSKELLDVAQQRVDMEKRILSEPLKRDLLADAKKLYFDNVGIGALADRLPEQIAQLMEEWNIIVNDNVPKQRKLELPANSLDPSAVERPIPAKIPNAYFRLLQLLPREFRQECGEELIGFLKDGLTELKGDRVSARIFVFSETIDLALFIGRNQILRFKRHRDKQARLQ